jgi:hypothetical protein
MVGQSSIKGYKRDLSGSVVGRLTVIRYFGPATGRRESVWLCRCTCGNEVLVLQHRLTRGRTRSCGCLASDNSRSALKYAQRLNTTHGLSKSSEYCVWTNLMTRCYRPNSDHYEFYGARGIVVCERWHSFEAFLADMGIKPGKLFTIERIDTTGNYEPSNCRWATRYEQARNRTSNHWIEIDGVARILTDWCKIKQIKITTVAQRLRRGWDPVRAILTPVATIR